MKTPCKIWGGLIDKRSGYGRHQLGGKKDVYAHRLAWELCHGSIPRGMVVDHICRVRSCVNPDHLRVVTPQQNATENSDSTAAIFARRTECERCGNKNLIVRKDRGRVCFPCKREYARKYHARRMATDTSHRERCAAQARKYRLDHSDDRAYRERCAAACRKYRDKTASRSPPEDDA